MKVSIIIPAYNVGKYIGRTLQSCIAQTYRDIEIVIINDGSTDRTEEVLTEITDPRIVKIKQANKGVSAARNMGLKIAIGDFCIFLDGDDWLEQDAVECLVEAYNREKCFVVSTYKDAFFENAGVRIDGSMTLVGKEGRTKWVNYYWSSKPYFNLKSSCYKLFDMRVITHNNIRFDNTISHGEDGLFVCQYLQYVDEIYYLPKQLWVILNRPGSASRSAYEPSQLSFFRALDKMEHISKTEDDKIFFKQYKAERAYYFAWQYIISKNWDNNSMRELRKALYNGANTYIFGKTKLRWKIKYLYMLLWFGCHGDKGGK